MERDELIIEVLNQTSIEDQLMVLEGIMGSVSVMSSDGLCIGTAAQHISLEVNEDGNRILMTINGAA